MILTEDSRAVSETRQYGYGLNRQIVVREGREIALYYHSGDMDGFAAMYAFAPELNAGFVLLVTRGGEGKDALQGVLFQDLLGAPDA